MRTLVKRYNLNTNDYEEDRPIITKTKNESKVAAPTSTH